MRYHVIIENDEYEGSINTDDIDKARELMQNLSELTGSEVVIYDDFSHGIIESSLDPQ